MTSSEAVLIVIASGLARLVPALGAMAAIRAAHPGAHVVALTSPSTADFVCASPYADEAWPDPARGSRDIRAWRALRARLRTRDWARVYDLDADRHSGHIFWLAYGRRALRAARGAVPWSGVIPGTALAWTDPHRPRMHVCDQWARQLQAAGIPMIPPSDLSWVARRVTAFNVPFRMSEPYVLVAADPGPGGPWPRLAAFAAQAAGEGRVPVAIGLADPDTDPGAVERVAGLADACPGLVDLVGRVSVSEMVFLMWAAAGAVGADTGVMHLAAASGCRSVILYDGRSDPARAGQRGARTTILRRPRLDDIPVAEVLAALRRL